ncbi:MAG: hypothetical protein JWN98_1699 [Abditibacteriota bacterium]|nr:hypothetical protein [Abditibacteriota bacterium]
MQSTLMRVARKGLGLCLSSWLLCTALGGLQSTSAQSTSQTGAQTKAAKSSQVAGVLAAPQRAPLQFFASTDRKKQNEDYKMIAPGQTLRVPLAAGRLLRLWSTSSEPEQFALQLQNGATLDLVRDNHARAGKWSHKAFTLYPDEGTVPALRNLKAGATLLATNRAVKPAKWYYQATLGAPLPLVAASAASKEASMQTSFQLAANGAQDLKPQTPSGIWSAIEIELPSVKPRDTLDAWRSLRLQGRWKGEDKLGIDVPLLSLTGQFWKADAVKAQAVEFDGKVLTWRLPIAFGPEDRVSLFNSGTKKIEIATRLHHVPGSQSADQSTLPRLHGLFGSTRTKHGMPVPILKASGSGAFVGLALDIRPIAETTRRSFAYLEGNEIIVADNKRYEGTGTEDFFNSAWYFPEKPFVDEFGGMTFKNALPPQVSSVRWMLPDALPFRRSLDFTFEHGRANNSQDLEYRWAAFWYQQPGGEFAVADALKYGATVEQGTSKNRERDALVRRYILGTLATMIVAGAIAVALAQRRKRGSSPD